MGPVNLHEFCDGYTKKFHLEIPTDARKILEDGLGKYTMRLLQVLNICNQLLQSAHAAAVQQAINLAIDDNLSQYERFLIHDLSNKTAKGLILALAGEDNAKPISADFITKHRLGNHSVVHKHLGKLRQG
jgi:uncharacterized membrane protein